VQTAPPALEESTSQSKPRSGVHARQPTLSQLWHAAYRRSEAEPLKLGKRARCERLWSLV
jgi:hypothetical protein